MDVIPITDPMQDKGETSMISKVNLPPLSTHNEGHVAIPITYSSQVCPPLTSPNNVASKMGKKTSLSTWKRRARGGMSMDHIEKLESNLSMTIHSPNKKGGTMGG